MRNILEVLERRNQLSKLIPDMTPEEVAKSQYYIGESIYNTFRTCTKLSDSDINIALEILYERPPCSSKEISDELFDSCSCKRNRITPMMIGKSYIPMLKQTGMLEVVTDISGNRYRLNGFKH